MSAITYYTWKYPQLSLSVREGMSKSEEYISIVRKGLFPSEPFFPLPETGLEEQISIDTPAGAAEVLYLPNREIFEYFVRVLAYRCAPGKKKCSGLKATPTGKAADWKIM